MPRSSGISTPSATPSSPCQSEPPVAHILTVGVVRRQAVIGALRELGVRDVEARDPIEWEREIVARG